MTLDRIRQASEKAAEWAQERDAAIRDAWPAHTIRVIAEAAKLSPARVHQIIRPRKDPA